MNAKKRMVTLPGLGHELKKDRSTIVGKLESGELVPDAVAGRMLLFDLARLAEIKNLFSAAGHITCKS